MVDDFGVKNISKDDVVHLMKSLHSRSTLTEDWTGDLYRGINLVWDYKKREVDISMPGYIKKKLQEYGHIFPQRIKQCPYTLEPRQFGKEAQAPTPPPGDTPKLDAAGMKSVRCVSFLAGIVSYKSSINHCFTTPATFILTKFVPNIN